jgi:type I restriction enzyme, S subunit
MKLETFFEKFDQFAGAPDAVARMRELVLELSATGRLIPEALERPVAEDTKLMGTIVELVMGQAPAGDECNTEGRGTVFVKVGEFGPLYPREEVWTTNPLKFAKKGDVLVCVVGATVGKLNLAIDCAIGRSVAAIRPSTVLDTKFLYYSLIPYTLRLRRNSRGSAQGVIGKAELNAVSLWVPSREIQKRIVAKVDDLMALCDRLEAQESAARKMASALMDAAIHAILKK